MSECKIKRFKDFFFLIVSSDIFLKLLVGETKTSILLYNFYSWRAIFTTSQESQYINLKIFLHFFRFIFGFVFFMLKTQNHAKPAKPSKLNKQVTINQFCTSRLHILCFKRNTTCIGCHCLPLQETTFHNQGGWDFSKTNHLWLPCILSFHHQFPSAEEKWIQKQDILFILFYLPHCYEKPKSNIKLQSRKPYSHPVSALLGLRLVSCVVYFLRVCVLVFLL